MASTISQWGIAFWFPQLEHWSVVFSTRCCDVFGQANVSIGIVLARNTASLALMDMAWLV
jgi:hypothetical protein